MHTGKTMWGRISLCNLCLKHSECKVFGCYTACFVSKNVKRISIKFSFDDTELFSFSQGENNNNNNNYNNKLKSKMMVMEVVTVICPYLPIRTFILPVCTTQSEYRRTDSSRPVSFTVCAWKWVYATNLSRLQKETRERERETSKRHVGEAHSVLTTAILLPHRLSQGFPNFFS
jgi:hypothetical protein